MAFSKEFPAVPGANHDATIGKALRWTALTALRAFASARLGETDK